MGQREDLLRAFNSDRIYAHEILFAHRHKDVTPEIHHQILRAFYGPHPKFESPVPGILLLDLCRQLLRHGVRAPEGGEGGADE